MNDLTIQTIIIASITLLSMIGNLILSAEDIKGLRISNKSLLVELVEKSEIKTLVINGYR